MTNCEDCSEETEKRKHCPRCGQLVCGWCWNHVHRMHVEKDKAGGDR